VLVSAVVPDLITAGACNVFSGSVEARPVAIADGKTVFDDVPKETTSCPWWLETAG
jgi:hypothetical protein